MAPESLVHRGDRQSIDLRLRSIVDRFDLLWNNATPDIEAFWHSAGADKSLRLLSCLIKIELERRFDRGERPSAAEYFVKFPELMADNERTLSLIYEEFCFLEENACNPRVSDFCQRYSRWTDSLVSQLAYHQQLSQLVAPRSRPRFPIEGERFASYKLDKLIGEGGSANVYLATDDLGGREVVLKVSEAGSIGQEPSILAQIDHNNIVPIFTIAEEPSSGLRGICMPYRPGVTLEALMRRIGAGERPRKASVIRDSLRELGGPGEVMGVGWDRFPADGTFHEAVSWIGLSMANALAYLEPKGILHRDIKPANIWLSHRDGPLLFDFNLAHHPSDAICAQKALRGGTLPYMAPEQLSAFLDESKWEGVRGPADIYSLGLVLREMVTGVTPRKFDSKMPLTRVINAYHDLCKDRSGTIREAFPEVPPSLDAIIAKCLAFRVEDRYLRPKALAEDLSCFLERRPLIHAENPSRLEGASNWLHRNGRRGLAIISVCLSILFFGLLFAIWSRHLGPIQQNVSFKRAVMDLDSPDPARWAKASAVFDDLEKTYSRSAWPVLYKAIAHQQLDRKVEAQGDYMRLQTYDDALDAFRYRLAENRPSGPFLAAMGWCLKSRGCLEEASELLEHANRVDPSNEWAWFIHGLVARDRQMDAKAILFFRKAIDRGRANFLERPRLRSWQDALTFTCVDQVVHAIDDPARVGDLASLDTAIANLASEAVRLKEQEQTSSDVLLPAVRGFAKAGQAWRSIRERGTVDEADLRQFRSCLSDLGESRRKLDDDRSIAARSRTENEVFLKDKIDIVERWLVEAQERPPASRP